MRSIKQRDIKLVCPECSEKCERILDISSFQLKGDCWAKDGYSKKVE
jgi:predicted nucleic acid-binding Zn ribbon protein